MAARAVLAERGYAGTSIAGICERAELSPTSIYWHFGSKAGLFEALLEQNSGEFLERIRTAVAQADDPLDKLDLLIGSLRRLVTEQPFGSLTTVALLSEGRHASPELLEAHKRSRAAELETIAEDFRAVLGPDVPDLDLVALLVTAFSNYAALTHRIDSDGSEVDAIFDGLRRVVLRLLRPVLGIATDAGKIV